MNLFDVYPLYDVTPVKSKGCYVYDDEGQKYLDLYGGHGVISIGHSHENYVRRMSEQLEKIGFYSNSIQNPLQAELARKLGKLSGCEAYNLFLCNSGAEANENALKLASFHTGKSKILTFRNAFHGRTSAAVSVTDNQKIQAPVNQNQNVEFLELNNAEEFNEAIEKGDVAAVIIEGIQGVGGLNEASTEFFELIQKQCEAQGTVLILDEIQSGYGRSGKFFAFQHHNINPDIICIAKGMGNGFPIAGVMISEKIKAWYGMLGTTFGGNHLACAAGISVLDTIEQEQIIENVKMTSAYFIKQIESVAEVIQIKGKGLMLGLKFDFKIAELRKALIFEEHIFTGGSSDPYLLRILPPLSVTKEQLDTFINALKKILERLKNKN